MNEPKERLRQRREINNWEEEIVPGVVYFGVTYWGCDYPPLHPINKRYHQPSGLESMQNTFVRQNFLTTEFKNF